MDDRNANQTWATTLLHASMYVMVVCQKKWYAKVVWRLVRKRPEWHEDNKDDMSTTFSLTVEKSLPSKETINVCKGLGIHTAAFSCECFWSTFHYQSQNSCWQWHDNVTHSIESTVEQPQQSRKRSHQYITGTQVVGKHTIKNVPSNIRCILANCLSSL
jgi:hypothetical protein